MSSFTATCIDDYDKAISRVNELLALAADKSAYYYVRVCDLVSRFLKECS